MVDTCELLEFQELQNLFSDNHSLRMIATDIGVDGKVNVDRAKDVGDNILKSMTEKNVLQHTFGKIPSSDTLCISCQNQQRDNPNRSTIAVSKTHYCRNAV